MERFFEEQSFHNLADMYLKKTVAVARNEICAMRAQREGRAQEARLFKAMALAQQVHADLKDNEILNTLTNRLLLLSER